MLGRRLDGFDLSPVHNRFKRTFTDAVEDLSSIDRFDAWRDIYIYEFSLHIH